MSDSNAISCRITLLPIFPVAPSTTIFGDSDFGGEDTLSNTACAHQIQNEQHQKMVQYFDKCNNLTTHQFLSLEAP
jgi:hypothetical protein